MDDEAGATRQVEGGVFCQKAQFYTTFNFHWLLTDGN